MSAAGGTFGGWVSADPVDEAHARALRDLLLSMPNLVWRLSPYDSAAMSVAPAGADPQRTMAVDLRGGLAPVHDAWGGGTGTMLRAVRKARRSLLSTRTAECAADWDAYADLYALSLERWGSRVSSRYERSLFTHLAAADSRHVKLWLACLEGRPVAGAIVVYAAQHAAYWHGAADAAYFDRRPVNLLMHDIVVNAAMRGLSWFDFNPSGGHEGVERFKRHCGAEPLSAPVVRTPAQPVMSAAPSAPTALAAG
jgi:hypothetical protein